MHLPFNLSNLFSIPFLLASVSMIFLGSYVWVRGGERRERPSFAVLCVIFFVWLLGTFLGYAAETKDVIRTALHITYAGVCFISPGLYWYASEWLDLAAQHRRRIQLGFVLGALLLALIIFTPWIVYDIRLFFWGYHSQLTVPGGAAFLTFFSVYMIFFFQALYQGYQRAESENLKKQIKLVALAFGIANLGTSDFWACYGHEIFPMGGLTMFIAFTSLFYTIIRYRLLDIETVIHKTLMWVASIGVSLLPFGLAMYFLHEKIRHLPSQAFMAVILGFSVVFYFYFQTVQPFLTRLIRRQSTNLDKRLNDFSKELVHLRQLRELLQRLTRTIRRALYVIDVSVYLLDEEKRQFVPVIVKRVRGLKPVAQDHPVIQWFQKTDRVMVSDLAESDPEIREFKKEFIGYFEETQSKVAVPLVALGNLLGVIHLGRKENLRRYSSAEIEFLTRLKFPVTIAVSNSRQYENVTALYDQVQKQNQRLRELDRLKSEFLANTSHELRTPLNGILGLVEAVLDGADGPVNDPQRKHLQMIIESGANLKELINNLLELSRMESGQMKLQCKSFNVLNVIDAVLTLLEGVARKKNIKLERIAVMKSADIYGDPEKIQRVITNLIGNAIKFTPQGKVTVQVEEEGAQVRIHVIDTGIGISEADQKVIFERFRQADGSSTRVYEGTGLGLSIAKEMVLLHGGTIDVSSELGKGSTFTLTLPKQAVGGAVSRPTAEVVTQEVPVVSSLNRSLESPGKNAAYQLETDKEFQEAVSGKGEKILIIDDNQINREVVKTRLEISGYKVAEAQDGLEGLEKIKTEAPNLVILDLMMPRMSGYEFCKKVRENFSTDQLPVIMLTAKTDMGDKIYGLHLGANDYISKPFNKEELVARVGILIKVRQMTQQLRRWNDELEVMVDERTKELVKTQEQLIQAEKLATIGTLAGGVAHEINNPLTAVLTNAQILKMMANPEDEETIALIEEGAKRCQIIVQKLLKYARQPQQDAKAREVEMSDVIKNTVSMFKYQLAQDNVEIQLHFEPGSYGVEGVSNELEQVFTNMLINSRDAVKAAKRSGVIDFRLSRKDGMVHVEVADNGIGIKKEHLTRIFDPFFTTKDVGEGTGLGLAVTQSILQKHSCKTTVKSEEGKGTTFILDFPAAEAGKMKAGN